MGRLTPEEIEELRKQAEGRGVKDPVGRTDVRTPVVSRDRTTGRGLPGVKWWGLPETPDPDELPPLGESLRRADRLIGLGVGSIMADPRQYPEAFRAFRDETRRGDWDAAIEAYQDVFDMPKGYWGTAEAIGPGLLTGGLAGAGKGLTSAAPKLSQTLGRFSPRAVPAIETGLRGIGRGLKAPWEAETAVTGAVLKGLTYPFRKGASWISGRTGAEAVTEAGERVDDLTRGKKPPKRATRVEAERGPSEINLDPMAGFEDAPKLGWWSNSVNSLKAITKGLLGPKRRIDLEGVIETADRVQKNIVSKAESAANTVRMFVRKGIQDNFKVDPETGYILDDALQNRARMSFKEREVVLQSPTIQDIAARYDTYERFLTEGQKVFMRTLRNMVEDGTSWDVAGTKMSIPGWNKVMRDNMPGFAPERIRPDITGNGFYLTRGATKRGQEVATSIADELEKMVTARKARPRGKIAAEQRARMPAMGKLVDVNGKVIPHVDTKGRAIKYDSFDKTMEDYIKGVADRVTGRRVQQKIKQLVKKYPGTGRIKGTRLGIIEGVDEADDALAAAINREFGRSVGERLANFPLIRDINNMYRGLKANFDLSALSIQGHLAISRSGKQWVQATRLIFKSLAETIRGSRGQEIVDEGIEKIDIDAVANGRLVSRIWATFGLRIGGTAVETELPGTERLLRKGGEGIRGRVGAGARRIGEAFQLSNRLYGAWGDVLRLRWADELLRQELAKGRTIQQLFNSGELEQIANAANRLTGWSYKRFGGDIGELTMFAARFFQARLETIGRSLVGVSQLRPPTRAALGAMGRTRLNLPFQGRPMIESDVLASIGRKQTIENREALQSIIRMIGLGVSATEMANAMLGNETDRRPIVDGRINPNFYTIRIGGRDFSLFGPTIGLLRAIGTLGVEMTRDPSRPDKAMAAASKALAGGVVRLIWDNLTGYGFMGKEAPIGLTREDPEKGLLADPMDILQYVGELAMPIAPGAVGGELFEGVKSARERDWGRVAGAGLAAVGEVAGVKVSPMSRKDEAEALSQEKYGVPYKSLTYQVQDEIDDLVTERMGEAGKRGRKGYLYEQKDEANAELIEATQKIANTYLLGSPAGTRYHPPSARDALNEAKAMHRKTVHGDKWSEEKGRITGGIHESLYDRDEEQEVPDENTREYRIWEYGQTFADATDPETGELDFDTLNKLQGRFWASLGFRTDPTTGRRVNEVDEMLESIRLIEGDFNPQVQYLVDAGRYAGSLKLNLGGETVGYYDLEDHKLVEDYIVSVTGVRRGAIRAYLDKGYEERRAERKSLQGERIGKALDKAVNKNGILWRLRQTFVTNAPEEWRLAMFEAGYRYQGKPEIERAMFERIRAGASLPRLDFKRLYRGTLIRQ